MWPSVPLGMPLSVSTFVVVWSLGSSTGYLGNAWGRLPACCRRSLPCVCECLCGSAAGVALRVGHCTRSSAPVTWLIRVPFRGADFGPCAACLFAGLPRRSLNGRVCVFGAALRLQLYLLRGAPPASLPLRSACCAAHSSRDPFVQWPPAGFGFSTWKKLLGAYPLSSGLLVRWSVFMFSHWVSSTVGLYGG